MAACDIRALLASAAAMQSELSDAGLRQAIIGAELNWLSATGSSAEVSPKAVLQRAAANKFTDRSEDELRTIIFQNLCGIREA